jgi:hypothetical protein
LSEDWRVSIQNSLLDKLQEKFGEENIRVCY